MQLHEVLSDSVERDHVAMVLEFLGEPERQGVRRGMNVRIDKLLRSTYEVEIPPLYN